MSLENIKAEDKAITMIIGVNKVAQKIGVSRNTIYSYIKRGMPHYRISDKKLAFDIEEVQNWLKKSFEVIRHE